MDYYFIIVLDKNETGPHGDWKVSRSAGTLEALLAQPHTHNDKTYPLPKDSFPGTQVQEIALYNIPLKKTDQGDIYRVPHFAQ